MYAYNHRTPRTGKTAATLMLMVGSSAAASPILFTSFLSEKDQTFANFIPPESATEICDPEFLGGCTICHGPLLLRRLDQLRRNLELDDQHVDEGA